MIHVETILIPSDTDVEQHPSHLCSKATSAANNNYIKEEVEQRLLSLTITSEGAIIRSHLISSINAFYIVIIEVNKQWNL